MSTLEQKAFEEKYQRAINVSGLTEHEAVLQFMEENEALLNAEANFQYDLTERGKFLGTDGQGNQMIVEADITDPESFRSPPDLNAFREMIARRIPDPTDPDRVTAYHLLKWYKRAMGAIGG